MSSKKKNQQKPKVTKKPVKQPDDACFQCGAAGGKHRDNGGDFLCDECWALDFEKSQSESESEEPESPEPNIKPTPVVKKPVNIQHLKPAGCDWCDKDGFMYVRENFLCHACIEWEKEDRSESESEPTEKPKPAQKRKDYDAKEVERYKKKMKELDVDPVEWKEHDMVKVDADCNFVCADLEKAQQFKKLFEEQEAFCLDFGTVFMELEPEDADAMNFQFKHTIAKAANIISNHIADTLGLKKQVQ